MSANRPVDVNSFPTDEKPHIVGMGHAINNLSDDVDKISGSTPEEKTLMHTLFGSTLRLLLGIHSKRGNLFLLSAQAAVVLFIADKLGIDIKLLGPIINKILEHLVAGN